MSDIKDYLQFDLQFLPNIDSLTHSFEPSKRKNIVKLWINSSNLMFPFIDLIILEFKNSNYQRSIDTQSKENELILMYLIKNNIIDILNVEDCDYYKIYNFQLTKASLLQLL